jgi:manganese/zinc/iron transport system substrate-binding protein
MISKLLRFRLLRLVTLILSAGLASTVSAAETGPVKVSVTTGMIADLVRQVGGDRVEVTQLMGPGIDPHLYKPTSSDASALGKADVVFYNGLMLEGRMGELFERLSKSGKNIRAVTDSIPEDRLISTPDFEDHHDPHLWFDVELWRQTVPAIVEGLSAADPEGRAIYEKNAADLDARLVALHAWCVSQAATLPESARILVTSHDAYNYFGRAYGFRVVGLQGASTVSEAALADVASLVDFIREQNVKAIFVESSVNPTTIQRVAADAGVGVGGELFSDAMGMPGEVVNGNDTGTYEGMVRHNLSTIIEALK